MNQTAPMGICCIQKFSGVIPPGPSHQGDKGWKGIQEKQRGRDEKEVKEKNRERRNNRKGGDGMRGVSKGSREGKALGEAQCSHITI
jgi:hypothetical protein